MDQVCTYIAWVEWSVANIWWIVGTFFGAVTAWCLFVEVGIQKAFWPGDDQ